MQLAKYSLDVKLVMPGLVPGIHVFAPGHQKTWMAGTSPAMTMRRRRRQGPPVKCDHPLPDGER
jgi:hypothetical protein